MITKNHLTEIASFRNSGNILQPFDDERNIIDLHEIKSSSSGIFANFSVSTLNLYLKNFFPESEIDISSKNTCSKDSSYQSPLIVCIFAEHPDSCPDKEIITELRTTLSIALDLVQENSGLFSKKDLGICLNKEKLYYIEKVVEKFLEKHGGKAVSKPFECQIGGEKKFSASIHGKIKGWAIRNLKQSDDEVFYAKIDGLKTSDMAIYLKLVDDSYKVRSVVPVTYKAEKPSHLKKAAHILTSNSALAKVVGYSKVDSKGVKHSFVKDIEHEKIENAEFSLSLTD